MSNYRTIFEENSGSLTSDLITSTYFFGQDIWDKLLRM